MRARAGIEFERDVIGVQALGVVRDQHAQRVFADDAGQFLGPGFGEMIGQIHGRIGSIGRKVSVIFILRGRKGKILTHMDRVRACAAAVKPAIV